MASELVRITKDSFLTAVAECAKEMPFAGSVMAVLGGLHRGRTELKFQTFLEEIGKPLAFGNAEAVVEHIARNIEEPWMVDGLERGWKALLETMDPTAKLCIYAMVADYMTQKKAPDRSHRQFGNLFMESDANILKTALFIADQIAEHLREGGFPRATIVWVMEKGGDPRQFFPELVLGGKKAVRLSEPPDELALILVRNSLAVIETGLGGGYPDKSRFQVRSELGSIVPHQADLWKQLRKYLEPVRVAKPST